MREILFRGKREDNGLWICGSLFTATTNRYIFPLAIASAAHKAQVVPETVGQFTGLYDGAKWEDLTDSEKMAFYKLHYIGKDGMSVRFQYIDDVKHLWKGRKIFEGDIVKGLFLFGMEIKAVVVFLDGAFGLQWNRGSVKEFSAFTSICNVKYEIVGNIHDNPELLEVTE